MKQTTTGKSRYPRLRPQHYFVYGLAGLLAWLGVLGGLYGTGGSSPPSSSPVAAEATPVAAFATAKPTTPDAALVARAVPASRGAESAVAAPPAVVAVGADEYYQLVSQTITETLREYTAIEVVVPRDDPRLLPFSLGSMQVSTVTVQAPYWINIDSYASPRQEQIDKSAPMLKDAFKWLPAASRQAKGTPGQIRAALQVALAIGEVRGVNGSWPPSKADIRNWMHQYGIGVDCSGFVYEALARVDAKLTAAGQPGLVWPLQAPATYTGTEALYRDSWPVSVPGDLLPGDVMYLAPNPIGHVRIVLAVRREGEAVVLTTAESTDSGADGVVQREWRYPDASYFTKLAVKTAAGWSLADRREQSALFSRRLPAIAPASGAAH